MACAAAAALTQTSPDRDRLRRSLALPIGLCAVQDVGTILVSLSAGGATDRVKLVTTCYFALGFPMGTAIATAASTASMASADGGDAAASALSTLRAFAGGLFLYLAVFELAPPHAHGRLANLRHLLAFAAGFAVIVLSEGVESSATFGAAVTGVNASAPGWGVGANANVSGGSGGAPAALSRDPQWT